MSAAQVSTVQAPLRDRARAVHAQFEASGTNISEWARTRGFSPKLVAEVLRGDRRCLRGDSHRVAVALGIKDAAPPPGTQSATLNTTPFEHVR